MFPDTSFKNSYGNNKFSFFCVFFYNFFYCSCFNYFRNDNSIYSFNGYWRIFYALHTLLLVCSFISSLSNQKGSKKKI
ncbi:hypothetical protein M0811_08846 [Anaeramoeba ignava]|uniref:Uncharacterized protein n=1 Tax=Anaeramoeba ignava TaxID=1746090 RepID=A0A9Q0RBD8_ANAIG|nr:hypothetical protein M0811_08846 [Anaeramoeba ignava]